MCTWHWGYDSFNCINVFLDVLQPSFNVYWNGWRDDTSGIRRFELQVFEMEFIVSEDGIRKKTIEQMQMFNSSQVRCMLKIIKLTLSLIFNKPLPTSG